ncbi:MAG: AAA family ATPase [Hyphomicrobiaceae bacterium]
MFNFLQRTPKASPVIVVEPPPADPSTPPDTDDLNGAASPPAANGAGSPGKGTFDGKTSADFTPRPGIFGEDAARAALAVIAKSKPRSIHFVAAPRTQGHTSAVLALLTTQAKALPQADAVAAVSTFDDRQSLTMLRLPAASAKALSDGVAQAIEMLSATLPAAFDSDSYKVARLSLDEELRSGHDTAIDALKRRALAQNIGLLRTPLGYAVAPMHEGRVVAPDVFKALPDGLKAGVEAKLSAFENELSSVLDNRTTLQQDHRFRLRDLDTEISSLTVRAALAALTKSFAEKSFAGKALAGNTFAGTAAVAAWLEALSADLVRNAALFVTASRHAGGYARAPIEIAQDSALARYRVNVLTSPAATSCLTTPQELDRADLCGGVCLPPPGTALVPYALNPGTLATAGGGLVVIDARELMAEFGAWPLIRQALDSGHARPADTASPTARPVNINLPIDARLIVTGDLEDYRAFRNADRDGTRSVKLITAFEPTIPLTRETEREFAGSVSAIVTEQSLLPVDGAAMLALIHDRTQTASGSSVLSTGLDPIRDVLVLANQNARSSARTIILAQDIMSALKQIADANDPVPQSPTAPLIPEVAK